MLEDISGTYNEDSFYATTFNSPTLILREGLNFLAYTWGLIGAESTRDGGHFPEAVAGKVVSSIPARLRTAGFSSREDLRTDPEKPFAPLALYDDEQRTLVISPFNHFLISPLRTIATPSGAGGRAWVARVRGRPSSRHNPADGAGVRPRSARDRLEVWRLAAGSG